MPPLSQFLLAGAALVVAGVVAIRVSGAEPRPGSPPGGSAAAARRRRAGGHRHARRVRYGSWAASAAHGRSSPTAMSGLSRSIGTCRSGRRAGGGGPSSGSASRAASSCGTTTGRCPSTPPLAAEPLVVIPHVWRGTTAELTQEGHLAAVARLGGSRESGWPARSVTRMVSVVERLLVLASVQRGADGSATLVPPSGGFVISGLDLDDAMRLLGGNRRWLLLAGYVLAVMGGLVGVGGVIGSSRALTRRAVVRTSLHEYERGIESAALPLLPSDHRFLPELPFGPEYEASGRADALPRTRSRPSKR